MSHASAMQADAITATSAQVVPSGAEPVGGGLVRIGVGAAVTLAVGLSLVATRSGPRATQDSANYLAMAAALARDGTLTGVSGAPITVFPPGYPALLAVGDALLGAWVWHRLLPALCAAVTVACVASIVARHVIDRRWVLIAAFATAVSPALGLVWMTTWSEGPFVAVVAVFLVATDRLWASGRDAGASSGSRRSSGWWRWLTVAVLACWAACALRYAGVVLIGVLGCAVALVDRPLTTRRFLRGALAGAVGAAALGAIVARNLVVDGTAAGGRAGTGDPPLAAVRMAADTLAGWVMPTTAVPAPIVWTAGALGVALIVVRGRASTEGGNRALTLLGERLASVAPIVWTCAAGLAFALVSCTVTSIDGLDDRLLSPIVVAAVVVVAVAADAVMVGASLSSRRRVVAVVSVWLCCLTGFSAAAAVDPPLSLSGGRWEGSELLAAVRALPSEAAVASNRPEALWLATDLDLVAPMPSRERRGWEPADPDAAALRRLVDCSGGSVLGVWFDDETSGNWIPPDALPASLHVETIATFAQGELVRISARDAASTAPPERTRCASS